MTNKFPSQETKKLSEITANKKKSFLLSSLIAILIFFILILLGYLLFENSFEAEKVKTERKYSEFEYSIGKIIYNNLDVADGLFAYMSTVNSINKDEIHEFINVLLFNKAHYVKHIIVLVDKTLLFTYPTDSDLSLYSEYISSVKRDSLFQGPLSLSDGSKEFILSFFTNRDDGVTYQINIVFNANELLQHISELEESLDINVQIITEGNNSIIYKNEFSSNKKDLTYYLETNKVRVKILVQPKNNWSDYRSSLVFLPFIALLVSIFFAYKFNTFLLKNYYVKSQSSHDQLTGIYNRTFLEKYSNRVFNIAKINKLNVGLIVININKFKNINDQYGRGVGDAALVEIAKILKLSLREGQEIFRISGAEFLIVLEDIESNVILAQIKERIRTSISEKIVIQDNELFISTSAGYSLFTGKEQTLDLLINLAYENMYINN